MTRDRQDRMYGAMHNMRPICTICGKFNLWVKDSDWSSRSVETSALVAELCPAGQGTRGQGRRMWSGKQSLKMILCNSWSRDTGAAWWCLTGKVLYNLKLYLKVYRYCNLINIDFLPLSVLYHQFYWKSQICVEWATEKLYSFKSYKSWDVTTLRFMFNCKNILISLRNFGLPLPALTIQLFWPFMFYVDEEDLKLKQ